MPCNRSYILSKWVSVFKLFDNIAEFETLETSAEFSFISACLKVAYNSVGTTRDKVTEEVAQLLECDVESLDFLFQENPSRRSDDEVFDFPDSARRRAALASIANCSFTPAE